ncbi:MAG: hypothetical protein FWG64_06475 [Firmicutes bacterium]|nr:hypothetical protein [Bacillota bacterium]
MKELLLNIYCPSASKSYDFWIPANMLVKQAIELICEDIVAIENDRKIFHDSETLILCSYQNKKILALNSNFKQSNVKSGDILTLV